MALPKIQTMTYELELPSTAEKVKYRPFLVKEQKILMQAHESEDPDDINNSLATIISQFISLLIIIIKFIIGTVTTPRPTFTI